LALYSYKARDEAGKAVRGNMEASSKEELVAKLGKMGYMVTEVAEAAISFRVESLFENLKRVNPQDMVMFTIHLSTMIN